MVLGPLLVHDSLILIAANVEDPLVVEAVAARVRLDRVNCAASISLQLRYAEVFLDGARLAQQVTLAFADPFTWPAFWPADPGPGSLDESAFTQPGRSATPRLLSVRATDVATMVVTDLSLGGCPAVRRS